MKKIIILSLLSFLIAWPCALSANQVTPSESTLNLRGIRELIVPAPAGMARVDTMFPELTLNRYALEELSHLAIFSPDPEGWKRMMQEAGTNKSPLDELNNWAETFTITAPQKRSGAGNNLQGRIKKFQDRSQTGSHSFGITPDAEFFSTKVIQKANRDYNQMTIWAYMVIDGYYVEINWTFAVPKSADASWAVIHEETILDWVRQLRALN